MICDPDSWYRIGRGHSLQYYAAIEEIEEILLTCLPEEYEPYNIVGSDVIQKDGKYIWIPFSFPVREYHSSLGGPGGRRWKFFLWSKRITPELHGQSGNDYDSLCSLSGLVNIQDGIVNHRDELAESGIGQVEKVQNRDTSNIYEHKAYFRIYGIIRAHIKRLLKYPAIVTFADGHEEISRLVMFTEKMAKLHAGGLSTAMRPFVS